ncbi:MAG: single-stranded DNA-binding protein [Clostridia bacterium]
MKNCDATNNVFLSGTIKQPPIFSHESYGEGFYEVMVEVARLSEQVDLVPVTVSEKIMGNKFEEGKNISIKGQFRSYNKIIDGKSKLVLTVFVREILDNDESLNPNIVELSGFICKPPVYRTTPFNREICDILIAVNRAYNKSDYIPCITWGRNARYARDAEIGSSIEIVGRVQSRSYQKRLEDGSVEDRIAYEVSVGKIFIKSQQVEDVVQP